MLENDFEFFKFIKIKMNIKTDKETVSKLGGIFWPTINIELKPWGTTEVTSEGDWFH